MVRNDTITLQTVVVLLYVLVYRSYEPAEADSKADDVTFENNDAGSLQDPEKEESGSSSGNTRSAQFEYSDDGIESTV